MATPFIAFKATFGGKTQSHATSLAQHREQILLLQVFRKYRKIMAEMSQSNKKSEDYLKWDDYFMALASLTALRSKDPRTKVGTCVVNEENRVVALGYNGMPNGCNDDEMPWGREGDWLNTKHPYVCHAEMNAIMNKTSSNLKNCRLFTTKFPCNECAKLIIQSGIRSVMFLRSPAQSDTVTAAQKLFSTVGITVNQHVPRKPVTLCFD